MPEDEGGGPGPRPSLSTGKWLLCAGAVLLMLALSDLMVPPPAQAQQQPSAASGKQPKFASKAFVGPTIKFMYCYSWGYRRVFEQYAGMLQQKYPTLAIEGDNFPPPTWKWQLAQLMGYAKLAVIICILANFNPFVYLGETPSMFQWAMENKFYACMMLFFVSNAVESQLVSTGAFEISVDSMPLWSKIESGRIPQPPELFQIIDNHFKMNAGQENYLNPGAGAGGMDGFRDEL